MAYTPSLKNLDDITDEDQEFKPSLSMLGEEEAAPYLYNSNPSYGEKLSQFVGKPSLPPGLNIITGLASLMAKNPIERKAMANIPEIAMGMQPTTSQKIEQTIGQTMPFFATPEAGIGRAGAVLDKIPFLGNFLHGAISRGIPQAATGATVNENPMEGAKEAGGWQLGLEALGAVPKGLASTAEWMNPLKYANEKLSDITDYFNKMKKEQTKAYSYMNPLKEEKAIDNPASLFDDEEKAFYTPAVKKLYKVFLDNPTIGNAHKLQSQMFSSSNAMKGVDQLTTSSKEALTSSREKLQDLIGDRLKEISPKVADEYNKGRQITRDIISPLQSSQTLRKITKGKLTNIDPNKLASTIKSGYESGKIPENHFLMKNLKDLQDRIGLGQALQYGVPMGVGAALGEHMMPGMGMAGGIPAGAAFAKYLEPGFLSLAQNPMLVKGLKNYLSPAATIAGRGLMGYNMNQ